MDTISFCTNTSKYGCNSETWGFWSYHSMQKFLATNSVEKASENGAGISLFTLLNIETNTSLNVLMTQPLIPQKIRKQTKISPQFQQHFKVSLFFLVSKNQPPLSQLHFQGTKRNSKVRPPGRRSCVASKLQSFGNKKVTTVALSFATCFCLLSFLVGFILATLCYHVVETWHWQRVRMKIICNIKESRINR